MKNRSLIKISSQILRQKTRA